MSDTHAATDSISDRFRDQCEAIVKTLRLDQNGPIKRIRALPGGVSSDIALVTVGDTQVCIKCALDQLRVDAPWFAPVARNQSEYRWLEFASSVVPAAVPKLYGIDKAANGFAMQYIAPDQAWNYKNGLLGGRDDTGQASAVGKAIAQIHSASTRADFRSEGLENPTDFHALRVEPYLLFTASRHPELAPRLRSLAAGLDDARITLIHGDVSPKNTLIAEHGPILLDAECASIGDPAFDLAFFNNHLTLKSIHLPAQAPMLMRAMQECVSAYKEHVSWESPDAVCDRTGALIPALMLARVDGKSPAEYLNLQEQSIIRELAVCMLNDDVTDISDIAERIVAAARHQTKAHP